MLDAQGGARARGRLHDGAEAGRADAAVGARGRASSARRPGCRPACFSVVTGDAEDAPLIGGELTSNPIVRKLGFTGSTEVGKLLMAQCATQVKKVSLELGGNAPFIVFDDADLDEAVAGALLCKYRNSGQTCISREPDPRAGRRLRRRSSSASSRRSTRLKVGAGTEPDVAGRPADRRSRRSTKVERHVADALERRRRARHRRQQARARRHVLRADRARPASRPTMAMSCEETFGPVAGIARFSTEEEAVAHGERHALRPRRVLLQPRRRPHLARRRRRSSTASSASTPGFISTEVAPFGGMKESGIGREGSKYGDRRVARDRSTSRMAGDRP